jgi:Uma2 family endonuclease
MSDSAATFAIPTSVTAPFPNDWTLADLQEHLGGIPLDRIRAWPPPGTATKEDVEAIHAHTKRSCELIDGVLVEKAVGFYESILAMRLAGFVGEYLKAHNIGIMAGEAGFVELLPAQVRAADVCVVCWKRLPPGDLAAEAIPAIVPDFVAEVLSKGNTRAEMRRKLRDYFTAGVRLVWYIDPRLRTARAYTSEEQFVEVNEQGSLLGGEVLPGLEVSMEAMFALPSPPSSEIQ